MIEIFKHPTYVKRNQKIYIVCCNPELKFELFITFVGTLSTKTVRLRSIEIFDTHEWLASSATVYFHCNGENKTILPDVKENHFLYTFKGEESWQV